MEKRNEELDNELAKSKKNVMIKENQDLKVSSEVTKGQDLDDSTTSEKVEINIEEYQRLKQSEVLAGRYLEALRQLQADFENFRRITEKNREQYVKHANEKLIKKLLEIHDDLQRALSSAKDPSESTVTLEDYETLLKGLQMIQENFQKLLASEGVKPIEARGKQFNPYEHEVVAVEDSKDLPDGTCMEELEKGYYFKDRIIRPAKVKISRNGGNIMKINQTS
ncbi:MAG: nucleotide exchange factor GrpE [Candidatus Helarchaeales archaeon]